MTEKPVTACVLIIGNEILSGRTQDVNVAFLGKRLNEIGIRVTEVRVIPDIEPVIVDTVNEVRARFDYVFTTGGIGPTHDDITAGCVAKAFGLPLTLNSKAKARLEAHYPPGQFNEARMRMAHTPEGAALIDNPVSTAPGFQVENVFVMAGIPAIMQAMFDGIVHRLAGGKPLLSRSLTLELGEGRIAKQLGALQERYPDVEMGSYPFNRQGNIGTRLVLRATDSVRLDAAARELDEVVKTLGAAAAWDRTEASRK